MRSAKSLITLMLLITIAMGSTVNAAVKKQKAIVKFVTGEVLYQKGSKGKWKKVKVGSKISESDMVRTFVESNAQLLLASGSQLTVEENTIVKMAELVQDGNASSTNVNVKKGSVLFNIKKLAERKSKFKFETLTATAAIRGTQGGIGFTGKRAYAYLSEGKMDLLTRSGKKVSIKAKDFVIQSEKGFEIKKLENQDDLKKFLQELITESQTVDITKIDSTVIDSIEIDTIPDVIDTLPEVQDTVTTTQDTIAANQEDVPLSLDLQTPEQVDVKNGVLNIRGKYTGNVTAKLFAAAGGKVTDISSKGQFFSYVLPINDKIGTWNLKEVILTLKDGGKTDIIKKIVVNADKTSKAVNTMPPRISVQPNTTTGEAIVVISNAKDDEIRYSIRSEEGVVEEETEKDIRYKYPLLPGIQNYEVTATDLAGNVVKQSLKGIEYWPAAVFNIEIDGASNGVIVLPPRLPRRDGRQERHPKETLEFEITGLPNDNSGYVKRIVVQNSALTRPSAIFENNTIEKDNRYRVDVELVRNTVNRISVRVEPMRGRQKTEFKSIQLK